MVKNLSASQKYHKMTHFYTTTVNQREHFGVCCIKNWIDSIHPILIHKFEGYTEKTDAERKEIQTSIMQASANLFLQNYMETRKIFVDYLYSSKKSPFYPVCSIFVRDEYQADKGNLPHMHMMIEVFMDKLNDEQKLMIEDLIGANVDEI